jgi:hypothetical protein
VADPSPSEVTLGPEARWWKGWATANSGFAQLFAQSPPGVRGRIVEVRIYRPEAGDGYAIQMAYVPEPPADDA